MTLRTALVIDGDASGATAAADQTDASLKRVHAASVAAARAEQVRAQAAVSALRASQAATREEIAAAVAVARKARAALDAARAEQAAAAASNAATAATKANTAAVAANNAALRQGMQQRTNLIFQLNDIFVSLASGMNPAMVAIQQGSQISTIYGPGGLGKALSETGKIAVGIATKFWPIAVAVAAVTAGVAGLQKAINESGKGIEVSFGDTALAVLETFAGYIWDVVGPAINAIGTWFDENVWPVIVKGTADTVNVMVRGWMGFLAELELIGTSITHIFDDTWVVIQNGFVGFMQELTDSVMRDVNALRRAFGQEPIEVKLDFMLAEGNSGWAGAALGKFNERMAAINSTDYASRIFGDIAQNARQNAIDRLSDDDKAGKQKKALDLVTGAVKAQRTAWDELASVGGNAFDRLTDSILSGGKDIVGTIQDIAGDFAKLVFQMSVTNPLKNFLLGGSATTFGGTGAGGGVGWLGNLLGFGGFSQPGRIPGTANLLNVGSFEGGGYTGSGPRAGGLDGRGGRLAMLHPDETVIDHTRNQGGVVINVANNYAGAAEVTARQTGTDAAGRAIIAIAVDQATQRIEGKMAKGSYRPFGVGPALKRS